ncbi:MAG: cytochrome c [Gaiellaceae bacterium]
MSQNRILIAVLLALAFVAAGCGGGGGGGGPDVDAASDPVPQGDPIAGRDAFLLGTDPACGDCHTLADAGTTATVGPNLDELKPTFDQVVQAVQTGPGAMPEFPEVGGTFLDNLAAYVSTAAGQSADE